MNVLEVVKVSKFFYDLVMVKVLKEVLLELKCGEFVSIIGKSGCGKSMLLYIFSIMDMDYEGELFIDGEVICGKLGSWLAWICNEKIGFVF